ncbi:MULTISPECIES: CrcB family protein [unclassified Planococcus (in: firmicutes)]|uniref:fluoride efflux transporter FluC n=1 Tax=unclassified Planococcus (in: firmicutes) TaxID=2662419 RepID=UPI0011EF9069|nr:MULTISPECIES: CrcB family protein [unclassified Planococcus (in: firmicutes)]KAA0957183.1 CrcB family protein [Planococcus sp. ANT_H30]MDJ0332806.1 CrcB family protein [Planococcus sp. S3-L1]
MIGIAIGGFLGAITRYVFYLLVESRLWQPKVATWLVNSIGSLVLGLFIGSGNLSVFWITGFLGAFTTFSTMALDVVKDLEGGKWLTGGGYVLLTVVSGVVLFSLGYGYML